MLETLEDRLQPSASPITLGAAGDFSVLGINGGQVQLDNASIVGNIGLGANESSSLLKTTDTGTLYVDPHAKANVSKTFTATGGEQTESLATAVSAADSASTALVGLTATQTFGNLTKSLTITGNGGTNVISVKSLDFTNKTLTLSGGANDVFIINVKDDFSFRDSKIVLTGGVTASQVLFNFSTRGPDITVSGDSVINGTFLAPDRTVDYQGHGTFNGAVIAKSIDIQSHADLTFAGFTPPAQPGSLKGFVYDDSTGIDVAQSGVSVTLTNTAGTVSTTTTTGADGSYSFAGLPPGTYTITETPPGNYSSLSASPGTVNGMTDGNEQNQSTINLITLASGNNGINYDFQNVVAGS